MDYSDVYQARESCYEDEHGRPWRNEAGWKTSGGSFWIEDGVWRLKKTAGRA